jgi:hypothetical protein
MQIQLSRIVLFILLTLATSFAMDVPDPTKEPQSGELSFKTRKLQEFQQEGWVTIAATTSGASSGFFIGQKDETYKILSIDENNVHSQEFLTFEDLFGLSKEEIDLNRVQVFVCFLQIIGKIPLIQLALEATDGRHMRAFVNAGWLHSTKLFALHGFNPVISNIFLFPTSFNFIESDRDGLHIHSLSGDKVESSRTVIPRKPAYRETETLEVNGYAGRQCIAFLNSDDSGKFVCLHNILTGVTLKTPNNIAYPFYSLSSLHFCQGNYFIITQKMLEFGAHAYLYPEVINMANPGLAQIINEILQNDYFKGWVSLYTWGTDELQKGREALRERFHSEVSIDKSPITILPIETDPLRVDGKGIVLPIKITFLFSGSGELDYTLRLPLTFDDLKAANAHNYVSSNLQHIMQSRPADIQMRQPINNFDSLFTLNKFWFQNIFCPYWVLYTPQVSSIKKPLLYFVEGGPQTTKGNPVKDPQMEELAHNGFFVVSANYPGSTFDEKSVEIAEGKCLSLSMSYFSVLHEEIMRTYGQFIDADKVAMVGGSYGGTIALMHSFDWKGKLAPNLKVCVATCPALDKENPQGRYVFGDSSLLMPANYAHKVNKPILLMHGKQDPRCLYKHTKAFVEKVPESLRDQFVTFISRNNMEHSACTEEQEYLSIRCIIQFLRYHLNYWEGPETLLAKDRERVENINIHLENAFATIEGRKWPLWLGNLTEKAA